MQASYAQAQAQARGTGWVRNTPDPRDWQYAASAQTLTSLPPVVDNDSLFPEPYDQMRTSSCVGQMVVACFEYARKYQGLPHMDASTLFAYWNARVRGGNTASDNGAMIRDGILGLQQEGVCESGLWPFAESQVLVRPPEEAFRRAREDVLVQFRAVQQVEQQIMAAIAEKYAVGIGTLIFRDFMEPPAGGIVPLPGPRERPEGAHAYAISGYDATRARYPEVLFKIHNSWGGGWGQNGRGWIPSSYLTNPQLAADATVFEIVRDDTPAPPVPVPVPTPDPWVHHVGDDIKAEMLKWGDVPLNREDYPTNEFNKSVGWSIIWARNVASGKYIRYWYLEFEKIVIRDPLP